MSHFVRDDRKRSVWVSLDRILICFLKLGFGGQQIDPVYWLSSMSRSITRANNSTVSLIISKNFHIFVGPASPVLLMWTEFCLRGSMQGRVGMQ